MGFRLEYLDVRHKWLDNTRTTVELIFRDIFDRDTILCYVHTDDSVEECKEQEDYYLDFLLNYIKEDIKKDK